MEGRLPWDVIFILGFHNIWLCPISLSFKFGEDQTSGCSDIPIFHLRGRLQLEVVFILSFNNIWLGPLSLSFKLGKDQTSGC